MCEERWTTNLQSTLTCLCTGLPARPHHCWFVSAGHTTRDQRGRAYMTHRLFSMNGVGCICAEPRCTHTHTTRGNNDGQTYLWFQINFCFYFYICSRWLAHSSAGKSSFSVSQARVRFLFRREFSIPSQPAIYLKPFWSCDHGQCKCLPFSSLFRILPSILGKQCWGIQHWSHRTMS